MYSSREEITAEKIILQITIQTNKRGGATRKDALEFVDKEMNAIKNHAINYFGAAQRLGPITDRQMFLDQFLSVLADLHKDLKMFVVRLYADKDGVAL